MVTQPKDLKTEWVLLSYRIPREPSTPRIAVWRKLKDLGVAQLGDGLVALPNNARTRESLEWVAAQVIDADGTAMVWVATPARRSDGTSIADDLRAARSLEYAALVEEIASEKADIGPRTIARWRRQWRKIDRRDYLRSEGRDEAKQVIANAALMSTQANVAVPR